MTAAIKQEPARGGPRFPVQAAIGNQAGMVLLLSLGLLAGLSLLALLAATSMLQQQQMAANHADGELARLSAMTAVSAGEQRLLGLPEASRAGDCLGNCFAKPVDSLFLDSSTTPANAEYLPDEWWLQFGQSIQPEPEPGVSDAGLELEWSLPGRNPPLFIIQELEFLPASQIPADQVPPVIGVGYYQILGRGTGRGTASTHVAESIVARPWLADPGTQVDTFNGCASFSPLVDCGRLAYRERR